MSFNNARDHARFSLSQFLKHKVSVNIQQTMVPEQDIGELWYFLATIQDKSYNRVEMRLRSGDVLLIDVLAFPSGKIQL